MVPTFPLSISLLTALAVQIACQLFKVVLYSIREKRIALSWFMSAGGMPSAHSAFVTALSVSVGLWSGFRSDVFAVAAVFSIIIIYDSWRLRGAVAHHARVLAKLVERHPDVEEGTLNLRLGHSLPEIMAGIAAGGGAAAAAWLVIRQL
jgi:acid phosphatase family membrane protein YuiD